MSKRDNLSDYLSDLYQGIKSKKPDASRNPQDFRGEIEQIETKSPEWDGSYETSPDMDFTDSPVIREAPDPITANGDYTAADLVAGADGISRFTVAVPTSDVPEYEFGTEGLSYALSSDGTYYACNGIGTATDTDIVISPVYRGLPVKEIADESFDGNASITSVSIPNSIEYIGKRAFQNCTALTSIEIPNSVTKINYYAFNGCTALLSAVIGKGVEWIGDYVFQGCLKMTTVTFANSGYNLAYMGQSVFNGCRSINVFEIPRGLPRLIFGTLYTNGGTKSGVTYQGITSLVIPSNVKILDDKAIASCIDLASVTFEGVPDSIGSQMFDNCKKLRDITVPWEEGTFPEAEAAWAALGATVHFKEKEASGCDRPLGYWFMTDNDQEYNIEWDEYETQIDIYNGVKESITVPPQVQDGSATSFKHLFSHYYYDAPGYMDVLGGVWAKEIRGVINCDNVTDLSDLVFACSHTEKICDFINTEKVKSFRSMFSGCSALISGPTIDVSGAEDLGGMYSGCTNLERMNVKNVKISFMPGNKWGGFGSMTPEGWADLCYELVNTGSTKTLTIGKSGITALQGIYIKDIDDSDPKKSFTLCESTDEGAITLADYVTLKNWALAGS